MFNGKFRLTLAVTNVEYDSHQALLEKNRAGIAQLVEHNLAKVGVASSSLVSRSNF